MGRLGKQINDTLAQIHGGVRTLYGEIERGPEANSPDDALGAFGALEETLGDAEALEQKLNELQKERNELKIQERGLIRELRDARLEMRKVPFEELVGVVRSAKSTDEEYAAAAKEIERRERMSLAIRHILVGKRKMPHKIPHKGRFCQAYWHFSSAAAEVRNETIEAIASRAFSEVDAKKLSVAVREVLCALGFCGGAGGAGQAGDGAMSLTEMCGLSAQHGPESVGLAEYLRLVGSKATVDAIIGTALKAKLRSMDPEHWDFGDESDEESDEESDSGAEEGCSVKRSRGRDEAQVDDGRCVKRSRGRDESMAVD